MATLAKSAGRRRHPAVNRRRGASGNRREGLPWTVAVPDGKCAPGAATCQDVPTTYCGRQSRLTPHLALFRYTYWSSFTCPIFAGAWAATTSRRPRKFYQSTEFLPFLRRNFSRVRGFEVARSDLLFWHSRHRYCSTVGLNATCRLSPTRIFPSCRSVPLMPNASLYRAFERPPEPSPALHTRWSFRDA